TIILISHIRYTRKRPDLHKKSSFKAPLTPFINYMVLLLFLAILVIMFISEETRSALLLTPIWFILLLFSYGMRKSAK
ncbi:hypothetical protein R0J88_22875, partial [Pseudoalteromonas sp. SIMBA_162]